MSFPDPATTGLMQSDPRGVWDLGASDPRAFRLARLKQLFGWCAPVAVAMVCVAAVAGAMFRAQPVVLASVVAVSVTVALQLRILGTRLLASLDDASTENELLQTALAALQAKEAKLQSLAYHDDLTGLPNRSLFYDRLGLAIRHSSREKSRLAVLFFDLDGFKAINDTFGHPFGDRVLVRLAERIRSSVRDEDTVARVGGDEFVVLLPQVTGAADAARVSRKILDALRAPFRLEGRDVAIDASVGVAVLPEDGVSADALVVAADREMYRAKHGRRDVEF